MEMRKGMAAIGFLLVCWGRGAFAAEGEQILAQVGEEVITVQEFLAFVSLIPSQNLQGDVEAGKRKLLEGLISQFLFAREAVELALDQDANVKTQLKQMRVNILAQTYLKRQAADRISISDKAVQEYFEAHRGDFQGRELKDVEGSIRAKLTQDAMVELIQKARTELREREKMTINDRLLKELPLPTR
jgi:EpsD family peptidyl-prolyl cis-trans isomerase